MKKPMEYSVGFFLIKSFENFKIAVPITTEKIICQSLVNCFAICYTIHRNPAVHVRLHILNRYFYLRESDAG